MPHKRPWGTPGMTTAATFTHAAAGAGIPQIGLSVTRVALADARLRLRVAAAAVNR